MSVEDKIREKIKDWLGGERAQSCSVTKEWFGKIYGWYLKEDYGEPPEFLGHNWKEVDNYLEIKILKSETYLDFNLGVGYY